MSLEALLAAAGAPLDAPRQPLHGGSMGEVTRVGDVVVKQRAGAGAMFEREAEGLVALGGAGARVPEVLHASTEGLVLRWLAPGPPDPEATGRMIARLHRDSLDEAPYGWPRSVYLGAFAFPAGEGAWPEVFRNLRLEPLLRATWSTLGPLGPRVRAWGEAVELPLEGASLVHGDLWSGNLLHTVDGPALIDPGVQRAERGLDLAMMELFGGFGGRCRAAYEEVWPVPQAVRAVIPGYQLIYLLVHVHFFGTGYLSGVADALDRLRA